MSDPSLGSERNSADHREENPLDASDRFFGAPPGKKYSAENAAPQHPLSVLSWAKQGVSVRLTV